MKGSDGQLHAAFEKGGTLHLAGIVKPYTFAGRGDIPNQWREFGPRLARLGAQGPAYGVVFDAGRDDGFDYMTAVEIDSAAPVPEGFKTRDVDAARYAVFHHAGNVASLNATLEAVHRDHAPSFAHWHVEGVHLIERYGENFDPSTGEGGIDVMLPLKT